MPHPVSARRSVGMRRYLQGQLPLAAALEGGDEGGVGDDIRGASLLLHQVDEVPGLLPLPACASRATDINTGASVPSTAIYIAIYRHLQPSCMEPKTSSRRGLEAVSFTVISGEHQDHLVHTTAWSTDTHPQTWRGAIHKLWRSSQASEGAGGHLGSRRR